MSEFIWPTNSRAGGVFDTTLRFQTASAASNNPARRPMRGSGLGGVAVLASAAVVGTACGAAAPDDVVDAEHAIKTNNPATSESAARRVVNLPTNVDDLITFLC
ncbi:MAG: hypothetical protein ACREF4_05240 [Gammaproteobacteria bacterium]